MGFNLARRLGTLLRFLFPSASARHYVRVLRRSDAFDRNFYIKANPRLRHVFRLAPERHYVLFGEALGLSPNPHFAPRAYLFHNPDLVAGAVPPLLHYIEVGQHEQRRVLLPDDQRGCDGAVMPVIGALPAPEHPVAVVLHLFYHDMWPEFATALRRQVFDFDLYVTITDTGTDDDADRLKQNILALFPKARIWTLPNHGRDIFPFLFLVNGGVLAPYRAICKLHTKKSPHRGDGDDWRRTLTRGILGDPDRTRARLWTFLDDPRAGFWVADGQFYQGDDWWGPNRPRAEALLGRVGITTGGRVLSFPAGSIYWVKPALIRRIRDLDLGVDDFEPEQALVDGTTAHAMERVLGYLAIDAGLEVREASDLPSDLASDLVGDPDQAC
jgi:Rhamnan synthesis protein F